MSKVFASQLDRMRSGRGFIAALDQSGGSTPRALELYGVKESAYGNDEEMFDMMHAMRTRIITSARFTGDSVVGAILFQSTLDRDIEGQPTSQYLWRNKQIVPFLKIDLGMADETDGVQLMNPIPDMEERLPLAKELEVFGTKMRSVIKEANADAIAAVVEQQFAFGKRIFGHGLVPVIEPEVDINSSSKAQCEYILRGELRKQLDSLNSDLQVMLKLTLPDAACFYDELCDHTKVLRVVALSGGYTREVANQRLAANPGIIASFSRALTEGLQVDQSEAEFSAQLGMAVENIATASMS